MADFKKDTAVAYADERAQNSPLSQHRLTTLETNPWWKFGGKDRSFIPTRDETSKSSLDAFNDPRDIENEHNDNANDSVFNNPKAFDVYKPIENYEGRHRFDPRATWSEAEEKILRRRVSDYLFNLNQSKRLNQH